MTTPMTIADVERLLRSGTPDEPAVLPPLALPVSTSPPRHVRVRMRGRVAEEHRWRLLVAIAALVALLVAAVTSGALRVFDDPDSLARACPFISGEPYDPECLPVEIPDGWTVLGAGQMHSGDASEDGLSHGFVQLVMASTPLGGCPSPGGPAPTAVPIASNAFEVPAPTPDAGLACVRNTVLPENGIRIVAMFGTRVSGSDAEGIAIADTSEPTEAAGWTEEVTGRPARLRVTMGGTAARPVETRTWDILAPGMIDYVLRIQADIAGPDLEAGRRAVAAVIETVRFLGDDPPPLADSDANAVLRRLLDDLDREARRSGSDYYACFPREPGSVMATISGGPSGPLGAPLAVTCSSAIDASRAEVWRVVLDVSWETTGGIAADTLRTEMFSTGQVEYGMLVYTGGYMTSLAGRPMPQVGAEAWFPTAAYELPPPLEGPLNLSPGSIVEMLWPGEGPGLEPGSGPDAYYPRVVGLHLYVLEGPRLEGGDEWYRVQWEPGGYAEIGWARGTREGRPLFRVVEPECPTGDPSVGDVTWLIAPERSLCFGNRELTFEGAQLVPLDSDDLAFCEAGAGAITPCPAGEPEFLTGQSLWRLYGRDGPTGPEPPLEVWLDPSVSVPDGGIVGQIHGHFDDPAAVGCDMPPSSYPGLEPDGPPEFEELLCRQRFVVTKLDPAE